MSQRDIAARRHLRSMSHEQTPSQAESSRSSRSIHLLSSTASTYRCAREYGVQQVAVYVMLAYDVNGCKDVLWPWINVRRRASMPDADLRRAAGLAAHRSWHPVHGWRERDWRKAPRLYSCMPRFSAASYTIRVPSATSYASSEDIHEAAEAHLWCHQRQAGPSGIREVQTDWQAYPGAVSVWENNFSRRVLHNYGSAVQDHVRPMPSRASTLASAR